MPQMNGHLSENASGRAVDLIDFNPKNVIKSGLNTVANERKQV